eukprot:TRINITY_DN61417_c0_g1_i1.p1 TRINITY_DN61417_c0_g1~~TRINITY_DN61417_c0_g1_i1.p1  ORF type:complete len:150 (+),score=28.42 TRINITY_DN61417_c0_g1_i1:38-487(+)
MFATVLVSMAALLGLCSAQVPSAGVPAVYVYDHLHNGGSFTLEVGTPTVGKFIQRNDVPIADWHAGDTIDFSTVDQSAQSGLSIPAEGVMVATLSDGTVCHLNYSHNGGMTAQATSDCDPQVVYTFADPNNGLSLIFAVNNLPKPGNLV